MISDQNRLARGDILNQRGYTWELTKSPAGAPDFVAAWNKVMNLDRFDLAR